MGWEGIIPNGSSRGERYSGSQKHRRPEFPTGEVGRAQWLSTTGRMLFSARQLCAARPFPPQCPVKSARSQGLLGRRQGRREGGEAVRLPCWQALEHTAANLPPPQGLPPSQCAHCRKMLRAQRGLLAASKHSVMLSHLVPTSPL